MRHARAAALDALEDILTALRGHEELRERKRGIFYRKSVAFLHFHEDPAGLFADVRLDGANFERYPVTSRKHQGDLLTRIRAVLYLRTRSIAHVESWVRLLDRQSRTRTLCPPYQDLDHHWAFELSRRVGRRGHARRHRRKDLPSQGGGCSAELRPRPS